VSASRHVVLLRGVNVGKAKRIAMADLRALVEGLGYGDVKTLLNSGNVVFSVPASVRGDVGARMEKALVAKTGVAARATVLTADDIATIIRENPLLDVATNPSRLLVAVLADPADRPKLATLSGGDWAPEAFAVGTRAAYLWMPDGVIDSRVGKALARAMGDAVTSRNWSTMLKLAALVGARS
jgi:uncharacterized protein (DUF1697 family)